MLVQEKVKRNNKKEKKYIIYTMGTEIIPKYINMVNISKRSESLIIKNWSHDSLDLENQTIKKM